MPLTWVRIEPGVYAADDEDGSLWTIEHEHIGNAWDVKHGDEYVTSGLTLTEAKDEVTWFIEHPA